MRTLLNHLLLAAGLLSASAATAQEGDPRRKRDSIRHENDSVDVREGDSTPKKKSPGAPVYRKRKKATEDTSRKTIPPDRAFRFCAALPVRFYHQPANK